MPLALRFLSSAEHMRQCFEECGKANSFWSTLTSIAFLFHTMEVRGDQHLFG